jgi:hypothetical protein
MTESSLLGLKFAQLCIIAGTLCVQSLAHAQLPCASAHVGTWFPRDLETGSGSVGAAVAMATDGERLAVSAPFYLQQGLQTGKVWVVAGWGASARVEAELLPPVYSNSMRFGGSLAFNEAGDVLVVGAPGSNQYGRVFVYRFNGVDWVQEWHTTEGVVDGLGWSVAVDAAGDRIAAGAPLRDNVGFTNYGAVVVYRRESGSWMEEATFTQVQLPQSRNIGFKVALSRDGGVLALSSAPYQGWPISSGLIHVLERTGNAWTSVAVLEEPVPYSTGGFGLGLSLDGEADTLAVGNPNDGRVAYSHGAVSIFRKGSAGWAYDTVLLPATPTPGGVFGRSVALNAAGDRLRAGAGGATVNSVNSAGMVEEFELSNGAWQRAALHISPTPEHDALFGHLTVQGSAMGGRWIVSEPGSDAHRPDAGQIHFFEARCLTPTVYCSAQTNTLGCTPQIESQGTPRASVASGFTLSAKLVRNQQNGMLLYGTNGRAALPWLGGTLCVQPPLRRTPLVNSGGAPSPADDCSGELTRDFNTWVSVANDPSLFAGQRVRAQFYSRDPGAPQNLNLTDAIEFYLEP